MAGYPGGVPDISIYAGDTVDFPTLTFLSGGEPIDLDEWNLWRATWRPSPESAHFVLLAIDFTEGSAGIVKVYASSDATRKMQTLTPHLRDGYGRWDLQATKGTETRTWVVGRTTHREDVTR